MELHPKQSAEGSHKYDGEPLSPEEFSVFLEANDAFCKSEDPKNEGGLVYDNQTGEAVGYFAHPNWRRSEGIEPKMFSHDLGYAAGIEPEVHVASEPGVPVASFFGDYDLNPELAANTLEPATTPGTSVEHAVDNAVNQVAFIDQVVERYGMTVSPYSIIQERPMYRNDVTDHKYVNDMVDDESKLGWNRIRFFGGAGIQMHFEYQNLETGAAALNAIQGVSHLLYGASMSGPHYHGQLQPNLAHEFGEEANSEYDHADWHSVRYATRKYGSKSGGIYTSPLPEIHEDIVDAMEAAMQEGAYPSPARLAGHHRDRLRIDKGTVELCMFDNFGYNVHKIEAFTHISKQFVDIVQEAVCDGVFDELVRDNPNIFATEVTDETLRIADQNSMEVSKHGMSAKVQKPNGQGFIQAREQMMDLLEFVQAYSTEEVPQQVIDEVRATIEEPIVEAGHEDTFFDGWYERGAKGTFSDWAKKYAAFMSQHKANDREVIVQAEEDAGQSLRTHLQAVGDRNRVGLNYEQNAA